jgi:hypothetical protein
MAYGDRVLRRGSKGPDVAELQLRLAGFRGTVPDGDFGPPTERQVRVFQRDVMRLEAPDGVAGGATLRALDGFADAYPIDFAALRCPCGECGGFGLGRYKRSYLPGRPREEAFYRYEYPGVHRMLLWAVRAVLFYLPEHRFTVTSCYRCETDNAKRGRSSTNHHGKAIDLDIVLAPGQGRREDRLLCNAARRRIVSSGAAQIGWRKPNRKALEPARIAPTWVHYDVRCYARRYLADSMFCTTPEALDARTPIRV